MRTEGVNHQRNQEESAIVRLLERIANALEAQVEATHRLADLQEQTIDPDEPTQDNPEGTLDPPTGELFAGQAIGGVIDYPNENGLGYGFSSANLG